MSGLDVGSVWSLVMVLGSGIWLWRRVYRRQMVQQAVHWLGLLVLFLVCTWIVSNEWSAAWTREFRLLRALLGVALTTQLIRVAANWGRGVGSSTQPPLLGRWQAGMILLLTLIMVSICGGLQALVPSREVYDVWIATTGMMVCVPVLLFRSMMLLPRMSPNDLLQHQPWVLSTVLVCASIFVLLRFESGAQALVAHVLVGGLVVPMAWATSRSAEFELSVERAGVDSVRVLRDALFLLNTKEIVDYANPAAHEMLRGKPNGIHIRRICPHWPQNGRTVLVRSDATRLPVVLNSAPLVVGGDVVGLAVSLTDVSELEAAVSEAQLARQRADEAARVRQEFLAVMSHEIRTPLHAILGLAHLLQDTKLDTLQSKWAQTICQSSDSLLVVLNDALDFARLESGKLRLESIAMDPKEQVHSALRIVDNLIVRAQLKVECKIGAMPERVRGDPTRIRQILLNLLSNAIKFTESGGIVVEAHYVDGELTVAVSDTGLGIPSDRLEYLFDAFVQADRSTTRRFGGVGLGLAISKNLAETMGGSLSVKSVLGEGSTFTLKVPAPSEKIPTSPVREILDAAMPSLKVLVVDDNPINQIVLQAILERFGMCSDLAHDGVEGVEKVLGGDYDLVFMDLQMPVKDGWEAIQEITDAMGEERPFLISHSAGVLDGDATRASENGAHSHLSKPAKPVDVQRCLMSALDVLRSRDVSVDSKV